ncbi:MAG: glycosyltransferase family 2 protein [Sphingomonas sp.]
MYLDLDPAGGHDTGRVGGRGYPCWSVLVPFFNERDYLAATISSLAKQSVPLTLILIDNGSTDGGAEVAQTACRTNGLAYLLVTEPRPGKVAALAAGLDWVRTRWVATCDADTLYPPHYLAAAEAILSRRDCVAAGAYFVPPGASSAARDAEARVVLTAARLLPRQSHAGGAGQAFRTEALRAADGFDTERWNYVLEDHEIIHRVQRHGVMGYSRDLWCMPSPRDRDRDSIRWTLFERLLYAACAPWAGDWFFYSFLTRRLRRRHLLSNHIRERQYQHLEGPVLGPPHPVF